jgi:hypothetical protein
MWPWAPKELDKILIPLVKSFFQINNVCLVKIQIESNIQKWATLMKQVTEFLRIRAEWPNPLVFVFLKIFYSLQVSIAF